MPIAQPARAVAACAVAALLALASPAHAARPKGCPEGETPLHGKCVKTCPIEGEFANPDDCECPSGYGKILSGNATGQCSRLRCPTNSPFDSKKSCDCPAPFQKVTYKKKRGQVRCELPKTAAAAHASPTTK